MLNKIVTSGRYTTCTVFPVDTVTDEAVSALVAKEVLAAALSPSCKVRSVAFDLAVTGDDARLGLARVAAVVEGRDVGVLVNNAGTTYPCTAYFHEVEAPMWEAVAQVNVEATAGEVGSSTASSAVRSFLASGWALLFAWVHDLFLSLTQNE